jgi:hypothetical protein
MSPQESKIPGVEVGILFLSPLLVLSDSGPVDRSLHSKRNTDDSILVMRLMGDLLTRFCCLRK